MTNSLDAFFAALSDPTRRAVVEQLTRGPAAVSALHEGHDMALPTFLRHLKVLEERGLVTSEKRGRVRTVRLSPEALRAGTTWIDTYRTAWEGRLDRLARLADHLERTRT